MTFTMHCLHSQQLRSVTAARSRFFESLRLALAAPLLAAVAILGASLPAFAEAGDPPGRVARLNLVEGEVSFAPADGVGEAAWTPAVPNRPLTEGDRIWTAPRSRSELHIGATTLRLGEQTSVDFLALGDDQMQIRLAQGTLQLRVRNFYEGQRLEVNTPNLAFVIAGAGDYRIDADPADDTTRVVVHSGGGTAYGDGGTALELDRGQQATFTGTRLAAGSAPPSPDAFDRWARGRDQLEERSVAARYVPREVVGYQQLDAYGDWQQHPGYGAVWLPRAVPAGWAPYRVGHWSYIAPWGWTWIDDAPWGFAPSHYGRWTQIGPRWGWVPGRIAPRPVYAPALVAFIGGRSGGASWNVAIGPDRRAQPAFGWFPLAPGEEFRPGYRVTPRYARSVNQNLTVNRLAESDARGFRYQRQPGAVSVARVDDFTGGRGAIRASAQLVQASELGRARVAVEANAMPPRPERLSGFSPPRPTSASALPPPALAARPVVGSEFGRDRTRIADPGARRNPEAGQPGVTTRDSGRSGPQTEPDKRQSGERRQAEQDRMGQPPQWQQGLPPPVPHQQPNDRRGQRAAPPPLPSPRSETGQPDSRPPVGAPAQPQRPAREVPGIPAQQPPMPRQQPIAGQADEHRQAQQAQQAQQLQRQQQLARQADQERQDQQRAQQVQQQAQAQEQAQRNAQQQQRQQQVNRQADQEQQRGQQQAQRNAQQQQEQARRQQANSRPAPAPPPVQPPGQARPLQPDQRGDERNNERRQRNTPGWEQR